MKCHISVRTKRQSTAAAGAHLPSLMEDETPNVAPAPAGNVVVVVHTKNAEQAEEVVATAAPDLDKETPVPSSEDGSSQSAPSPDKPSPVGSVSSAKNKSTPNLPAAASSSAGAAPSKKESFRAEGRPPSLETFKSLGNLQMEPNLPPAPM